MSETPDGVRPDKDPYPKMILVCIGISMSLLIVIVMVVLVDFIQRADPNITPPNPEAFESMLEAPRAPYSGGAEPATEAP